MDLGHDLHFGVFLSPDAERWPDVVATAQEAEVRGLDSVSLQDHPYQKAHLDTWTLLTHLAASTERLVLFPNVANLPLRPPAVLAQAAASLDLISSGRIELGLGAGAFWDAIAAYGGPRRSPGEAVEALDEGIRVIRRTWRQGPAPAHDVGIWVGAYGPRMLRLTGRLADGWLPSLGYAALEDLPAMNAVVDEAATAAGRDPREVRRLLNVSPGQLAGPPSAWVEQLAGLALDEGFSHFVLAAELGDHRALAAYAEEVAPAVRELVEAERITPGARPSPAPVVLAQQESFGDGDRLVAIHDHLRQELAQVRDLVEQVARGHLDAGRARGAVNQMTMRQNDWTLGTYCESYCRVVTLHHTIEDSSMYPRLLAAEPALQPAVDKMLGEHLEIHDLLESLDRALVALVGDPGAGVDGVRTALDALADSLLAHLEYEEGQLVEPLNRLGVGI